MYLVGSVHMLTEDFYHPLSKAFEEAFKDSDLLVEEADLAEMLSPSGPDADVVARDATVQPITRHGCPVPRPSRW